MSYYWRRDYLDWGCTGIFLFFLAVMAIYSLLSHKWHGLYVALGYIGIFFAIPFVLYVISGAYKKIRVRLKLKNTICPHGVKGGKTLNLCELCVKEEQDRLRLIAEEAERARIKARIKSEADALRNAEIKRFTKIRLKHKDELLSLSPSEFEDAVAAMYRRLGYSVEQTPYSGDFGIDIIASKNEAKYVIECKRYQPSRRIGRPDLQKFYAAMIDQKADRGFYVVTCGFASTAYAYVKRKNIELVDLDKLVLLMREAFVEVQDDDYMKVMCLECGDVVRFGQGEESVKKYCTNGHIVVNNLTEYELSPRLLSGKVYCDKCGREMRLIHGRRGKFWGCKGYPECRNTKPLRKEILVHYQETRSMRQLLR